MILLLGAVRKEISPEPSMPLSFLSTARSAYQRLIAAAEPLPLGLLVSLMTLTGIAWALTLFQAVGMSGPTVAAMPDNMAPIDMGRMAMPDIGWSIALLGVFMMIWTVMMAAMMLPAAMPMILIFTAAQARRNRQVTVPTWIFIAGYLLVWMILGLLVYGFIQATGVSVNRHPLADRIMWARFVLPTILIFAGMYQFTSLKDVCLRHCRSPSAFVTQHWRDGWGGALKMGVKHGLYCLGCCWALFTVLVAAGMMNFVWIVLLTVVIFAEKVLPNGTQTSAVVGLGLNTLGALIAASFLQPLAV
jgi:predicted metal-binding membrane protein